MRKPTMPKLSAISGDEWRELQEIVFPSMAGDETTVKELTHYGKPNGHIGYFVATLRSGRTVTVGVEVAPDHDDHYVFGRE